MGRQLSIKAMERPSDHMVYGGVLIKPREPLKGHMAQLAIAPMVKIPYLFLGLTDNPFWVIEQMINCQMQVRLVPTYKANWMIPLWLRLVPSPSMLSPPWMIRSPVKANLFSRPWLVARWKL